MGPVGDVAGPLQEVVEFAGGIGAFKGVFRGGSWALALTMERRVEPGGRWVGGALPCRVMYATGAACKANEKRPSLSSPVSLNLSPPLHSPPLWPRSPSPLAPFPTAPLAEQTLHYNKYNAIYVVQSSPIKR